MNNDSEPKLCQIHQQVCLALDLQPQCTYQSRYCCIECVKLRNNNRFVYRIEDAHNLFQNIKKQCLKKKHDQNFDNIRIFKELSSVLIQMQKNESLIFQQMIEKIEFQITHLTNSLEKFDEKSYLQSTENLFEEDSLTSKICEQLLIFISKISQEDLINKFQSHLSSIDCQTINLSLDSLEHINTKEFKPENFQETAKLNFLCPIHNLKIQLFDINIGTSKENRIFCEECLSERSFKQLTTLAKLQKLWSDQEIQFKHFCLSQQGNIKAKIDAAQQQFNQLKDSFINKIIFITNSLNDRRQTQEKLNEKIGLLSQRRMLMSIAEALSKQQNTEEMSTIAVDYKKCEELINTNIYEVSVQLQEIGESCFLTLGQLLNMQIKQQGFQEQETQTRRIELIDTSCNTELQLGEKINIINIEWKMKIEKKEVSCSCKEELQLCKSIITSEYKKLKKKKIMTINQETKFKFQIYHTDYQNLIDCQFNNLNTVRQFAFQPGTLLALGCQKNIKVFEFNVGQLFQRQLLEHGSKIKAIIITGKQDDEIIVGESDGLILIWRLNQFGKWWCNNKIDAHKESINCMIIDKKKQLLLSCSRTIKIWQFTLKLWELTQDFAPHEKSVQSISLNCSDTHLVSCGLDNKIIISKVCGTGKWSIIQAIQLKQLVQRVCYLTDSLFASQACNDAKMDIYKFNDKKQFSLWNDVKVGAGKLCKDIFQLMFNHDKQIILNQNGKTLNIIKFKGKEHFLVEQTIDFECEEVFGTLSEDGNYLITLDNFSKLIKIRKQQRDKN